MRIGVVTFGTFVEERRSLISTSRLGSVIQHLWVGTLGTTLLNFHLLRSHFVFLGLLLVLSQPLFAFGYYDFCLDWFSNKLFECICSLALLTGNLVGKAL